jgi:putative membrane protein
MFDKAIAAALVVGLASTLPGCAKSSSSDSQTPNDEQAQWDNDKQNTSITPNDNAGYRPAGNPESPASTSTSTVATRNLSDGEIAAIAEAANAAEVEQGQLAQTRAKDARVRDFAKMMVEHHSRAREQQKSLVVEQAQSTDASELSRSAKAELQMLDHKPASEFDLAYVQLQIQMHAKLLDRLQRELLPSTEDPGLRKYLEDITPQVQQHLARAEELESQLSASAGTTAPSADIPKRQTGAALNQSP